MLANTKIPLPWWFWIICIILMLPLFLGPLGAVTNPKLMGGPEAETVTHAAYFYAARNFSALLVFIVALWFRSAPMLFILIIMRLMIDLMDLPIFLSSGLSRNPPVAIAIFVFMYLISIIASVYLWRKMSSSQDSSVSKT
ncbi:MAG: hypothetical protein ACON4C_02440 [Henriciella sp.]